jgi:hypothetical protein
MKLKQLLEGYAWERNSDGSLPTLADSTAKHQANLNEVGFEPDSAVVDAFNQVVKTYRSATKSMDDEQAYKVSQQLSEFFT